MSNNKQHSIPNISTMSITSLASQLAQNSTSTNDTSIAGDKMKIAGSKIAGNKVAGNKIAGNKLHSKTTVAGMKANVNTHDSVTAQQQRQVLVSGATATIQDSPILQQLSQQYDLSNVTFLHSIFQQLLTTDTIGRTMIYLPSTTSTMEVAKLESMRGALHGTCILAEYQSAGRGRGQGRVWKSELKGNLYFTLILRPLTPALLPVINFAIPLAVCIGIRTILQQYNVDHTNVNIKWPNDIWIGAKKCCGVLLDVDVLSTQFVVSAGIGINVNEDMLLNDDTELHRIATSLYMTCKQHVSREQLLANICNQLERILLQYSKTVDILQEYKQYDMLLNQPIVVMPKKKEDQSSYYNATCIGYTDDGYMRVRTSDGQESILVSEEVSIRPQSK